MKLKYERNISANNYYGGHIQQNKYFKYNWKQQI